MPAVSPQENIVRVSTSRGETVTLTVDAGAPVTIQLDVGGQCNCEGTTRVAGAYTDTDFGTH
jgi:spore coat protein U-like protein